jgi:hypothetical protein
VREGLNELNFRKDNNEVIQLCRGNIFDQVRNYFLEEGINYEDAIVEGRLQDAVEGKLIDHLQSGFKKWNTVWRDRAIEKFRKIKSSYKNKKS